MKMERPTRPTSPNMNMNYQQYHTAAGATINSPITLPIPQRPRTVREISLVTTTYGLEPTSGSVPASTKMASSLSSFAILSKGLLKGQYFNPNCFAAPLPPTATSFGQNGQTIWPYIRTPHYFGSDLAIFKAFRVTDAQRVEIRISATNWLNHPNAQFGLAGNSDNQLLFNGLSSASGLTYNSNSSTTGVPTNKVGYRWMQFAAKYYF